MRPTEHAKPGPVFLLGPARSGTTLLHKALALHPEAAWLSNYLRRAPRLAQLNVIARLPAHLPTLRDRVWFGADRASAYAYGRPRPLWERAFPAPTECEPLYQLCGFDNNTSQQAVARELAVRCEAARRYSGGQVLVAKRIANNRRVPLLAEAFPSARFVCLVRDGRAVAASLRQVDWWESDIVWWYGGKPSDWERAGGDPWELAARTWVEDLRAVELGVDSVDSSRVFRLTYEDLVAAPVPTLRDVADFAGLPRSSRWESSIARLVISDRKGGWQRSVSGHDLLTVEHHQRADLLRHGYELSVNVPASHAQPAGVVQP